MSEPTAPDFASRAQASWERHLRVSDCFTLHAALFTDRSPTRELAGALSALDSSWARLRALPAGSPEAQALLKSVEAQVQEVETSALRADSTVPTASFRQAFSEDKTSYEAIVRYVQLLVSRLSESTDRRDRVEFLATRLLSVASGQGTKKLQPRATVEPVLRAISLGRTATPDIRSGSERQFKDIMARAVALTSVDEAFDGGLLLDIRGYKLSLGPNLVDPDVMYAVAAINVELANRLEALMREEGRAPEELRARYGELDEKLRKIFQESRSFEVPPPQKFSQPVKKAVVTPAWTKPKPAAAPRSTTRLTLTLAILVVAIAGGADLYWNWAASQPRMEAMPDKDLQALTPLLAHGSFLYYDGETGLEAELKPGWATLPDAEKAKAVDQVVHALAAQSFFRGMLWAPGHTQVVARFRGGQLQSSP